MYFTLHYTTLIITDFKHPTLSQMIDSNLSVINFSYCPMQMPQQEVGMHKCLTASTILQSFIQSTNCYFPIYLGEKDKACRRAAWHQLLCNQYACHLHCPHIPHIHTRIHIHACTKVPIMFRALYLANFPAVKNEFVTNEWGWYINSGKNLRLDELWR